MAQFSKKTIFIGAGLSAATLLATSLAFAAFKHDHHRGEHGGYHKGGKHGHIMKLHKLDQDDYNAISLSEFQAPAMKAFEKLDANQDGTISAEEYLARSQKLFAKFDADESGIIDESEFPKRLKRLKKSLGEDGVLAQSTNLDGAS